MDTTDSKEKKDRGPVRIPEWLEQEIAAIQADYMRRTGRRPPSKGDLGPREAAPITQRDLERLAQLQRSAWRAQEHATALAARLARRIDAGATVEGGALMFDISLGMARGRGQEE